MTSVSRSSGPEALRDARAPVWLSLTALAAAGQHAALNVANALGARLGGVVIAAGLGVLTLSLAFDRPAPGADLVRSA